MVDHRKNVLELCDELERIRARVAEWRSRCREHDSADVSHEQWSSRVRAESAFALGYIDSVAEEALRKVRTK
jgi:hypothetical protein